MMHAASDPLLLCMTKNERPYMLEWIAHHQLIGFSRILVVTNDNNDGSEFLYNALADNNIIDVIYHNVPEDIAPRKQASALAIENLSKKNYTGYVAHFDADEFLFLHKDNSIEDFLSRYPDADSIAINWRIFGSNGHSLQPQDLTLSSFSRCAPDDFHAHRDFKTISWFSDEMIEFDGHYAHFSSGRPMKHMHSDGSRLDNRTRQVAQYADYSKIVFEYAQLNHYIIKSRQEFNAKRLRGRIAKSKVVSREQSRYTRQFFPRYDRNELVASLPDAHIGGVRAKMQEMYDVCNLARVFSPDEVGLFQPCSGSN